ncbi:uncharacterized protein LOC131285937 [Anopheles ziemanni]|uniref:uncharacterized protein LOC131285937 n=1 Tax=Anopheles ziemanni TaxID=345580 RepID=UPI00265FFB76|nr:uncharacterized protein LOC131285937 [Anopheles ziemanni]
MANKTQISTLETLSDICRICLSSDEEPNNQVELYPVEDIYVEQCQLTDLVTSFRDILTVFVNDEIETHGRTLPSMICLNCAKRAQDAYKFVEQCRRTDQLLESHFSVFKLTEKLKVPHKDQHSPSKKESPRKSVKLSDRHSSAASIKPVQRLRKGESNIA